MIEQAANSRQVAGSHYTAHGRNDIQHWDIVAIFDLGYFEGQISKYLFRWKHKNGLQDLEKARHYLDKLIELETEKLNTTKPIQGEEQ